MGTILLAVLLFIILFVCAEIEWLTKLWNQRRQKKERIDKTAGKPSGDTVSGAQLAPETENDILINRPGDTCRDQHFLGLTDASN